MKADKFVALLIKLASEIDKEAKEFRNTHGCNPIVMTFSEGDGLEFAAGKTKKQGLTTYKKPYVTKRGLKNHIKVIKEFL